MTCSGAFSHTQLKQGKESRVRIVRQSLEGVAMSAPERLDLVRWTVAATYPHPLGWEPPDRDELVIAGSHGWRFSNRGPFPSQQTHG